VSEMERRDFLKLAGIGGVVFASSLSGFRPTEGGTRDDFVFVQMSDTHWGFAGPPNPDAGVTLQKAVTTLNSLERQPDFVVFTGDLTHTTDDPKERRQRMSQFRDIVSKIRAKTVRFMPGEHDASLDAGEAYRELFGETHYSFDHKGVHFIALDNVSDPTGSIGTSQLQWLETQLKALKPHVPVVILTHRPLFDLYPQWDWATRDGADALNILQARESVTVFYGHIHQEHHQMTGKIAHHSAKSLMFPLPAPGSVPKKAPIPWNAETPYAGLGFRSVQATDKGENLSLLEWPVVRSETRG
jgi:3',5'-cyclic AMP phosphodiesterase CpdA